MELLHQERDKKERADLLQYWNEEQEMWKCLFFSSFF